MGILLAFFAGWTVGTRAGSQSYEEVVTALKAVRDSEEVAELARALNGHFGYALREVGTRLIEVSESRPATFPDVVARVRDLVKPVSGTSPSS